MPKKYKPIRNKRRRSRKSQVKSKDWASYRAKLLELQAPFLRYGKQNQLFRKPNSERADITNGTIDDKPFHEVEAQIAKYKASNFVVRFFWRAGSRLSFNSIQTTRRLACFYQAQKMFGDIESIYIAKNPPSQQALNKLLEPVQSAAKGLGLFFSLRSPLNKLFKWFKKTKCTNLSASGYGSCGTDETPPARADSIEPDAGYSPAQDKASHHGSRQSPPVEEAPKAAPITAWKKPLAKELKPATTLDELHTKHEKASADLEALLQEQVSRLSVIHKNLKGSSSAKQKAIQSEIEASETLIKTFYRQVVARQFHPDRYQDKALKEQAQVYFVALTDDSEKLLERFKEQSSPAGIRISRPEDVIDFFKSLLMRRLHSLERKFVSVEKNSFAPFDEKYASALRHKGGDARLDALLEEAATKANELRVSVAQSKTEFETVKQVAQALNQYGLLEQIGKIEALSSRCWQIDDSLSSGKIWEPLYALSGRLWVEEAFAVHRIEMQADGEARAAKITADGEARAAKITADGEARAAKITADGEARAAKITADVEARAAESSREVAELKQMMLQALASQAEENSSSSDKREATSISKKNIIGERATEEVEISVASSGSTSEVKAKAGATEKVTNRPPRKSKKKGTAARSSSLPSAFFDADSESKVLPTGSTVGQAKRRVKSEPTKYKPGKYGTYQPGRFGSTGKP